MHHGVGRPVGARPLDNHHGAHDTHGGGAAGADEGETTGYDLGPHTYLCVEDISLELPFKTTQVQPSNSSPTLLL